MKPTRLLIPCLATLVFGCTAKVTQPTPTEGPAPAGALSIGPVVQAARPPAPISGGTLAVSHQGSENIAVAADPEADRVLVVSLSRRQVVARVDLQPGDEPGRVVIDDASGVAHVALRRGGAVAHINLADGSQLPRTQVCAAPRGLAFDPAQNRLYVACLDGELWAVSGATGEATLQARLDRDLRDVVVSGDRLLVSRFRSAEVLVLQKDGTPAYGTDKREVRVTPVSFAGPDGEFTPAVAWRMAAVPGGGAIVVHQRATTGTVRFETITNGVSHPGYGGSEASAIDGGCGGPGIVHTAITSIGGGYARSSPPLNLPLAVDIAVSAGGKVGVATSRGSAVMGDASATEAFAGPCGGGGTGFIGASGVGGAGAAPPDPLAVRIDFADGKLLASGAPRFDQPAGQGAFNPAAAPQSTTFVPVAVAFDSAEELVTLTQNPIALQFSGTTIALGDTTQADTGHQIFHMPTRAGIACASCHPEGGEDGHTWRFEKLGVRRTMPLRGGLLGAGPFHWNGDMQDFPTLMAEVFVHRMGGGAPSAEQSAALKTWIDAVPAPALSTPVDMVAVSRGQALFASADTACTSCHGGDRLSNNTIVNVGTGEPMKVPSLRNLAVRAPYLHTGCAKTLVDRFGPCGGGDLHGHTSQLSDGDRQDLAAFLETL